MPGEVTVLLRRWSEGDQRAFAELTPLIYDELRKLASAQLKGERSDHTLQPTTLAHEAYLKLVHRVTGNWQSRTQFYAVASQVIRRVLVDHARARLRQKRGRGAKLVTIDPSLDWPVDESIQITRLEDALEALATLDPVQSRIVELRFFTGLTIEETADVLKRSPATVKRAWASARAWLLCELATTPGRPRQSA